MKAVLVAMAVFVAAFLPVPVQAVEWTLLGQSDNNDTTLYYVERSVKVSGSYLRLQTKRVYSSERGRELSDDLGFPLAVAYSVEMETVDCSTMRRAVQRIVYYGEHGKILDRTTNQTYKWQPFLVGGLTSAVCEKLLADRPR